ncbi:MAG: hypothetical protein IJ891_11860 [Prevotella sp.]|nr:hypothetical protein [Prevotella sp.]
MEENNNLTAERSLEIITEQIAQSRKTVSKEVGQSLFVSGLCVIGIAILTTICLLLTGNTLFYLLYGLIRIDNYNKKDKPKAPVSLVGSMVDKTWQTFGIFALSFCVFAVLFNFFMGRINTPEMYARFAIHPFRIILLLMGMAITINGYILKSRWLIWCGIIGGIGGFIWQTFGVADMFLSRLFDLASFYHYSHIPPCIMVVLFAFVGVLLPGIMLKKQSL